MLYLLLGNVISEIITQEEYDQVNHYIAFLSYLFFFSPEQRQIIIILGDYSYAHSSKSG